MEKNYLENKMRSLQALNDTEQFNQTSTKTVLNLVQSVINQVEFFLPQLQTLLENLLKRKLSSADKVHVLMTLLQVNLKNNHLSNSLEIYETLNKKYKLTDMQKFKIDDLLSQKFLQLFQYDKAHQYCKKILENPIFINLESTVQIHHILDYAIILQNLKNYSFPYRFVDPQAQQVTIWLQQIYFKILKNQNNISLRRFLRQYETLMKDVEVLPEIKNNILLNLPIIRILIEQKHETCAYQLLKHFLSLPNLDNGEKMQVVLLLMPLAKEKNINEFLELTGQLNTCFQSAIQGYKNVAGNYTQLAYDNFALYNSLQEKERILKTDTLTHCESRIGLSDLRFNFKTSFGGIVFFDLNNLKSLNDSMGHTAGDKYLESFSAILLSFVSDTIKVFRFGGDEFLLIAHQHTKEQIDQIMQKIIKKSKKSIKISNKKFQISFAAGISMYPDNATTLNKLIILADKAMYKSKSEKDTGKNTYYYA